MFSVSIPATQFAEIPTYEENPISGASDGEMKGKAYIRASDISAVMVGNDGFAYIFVGHVGMPFKVKADDAKKIMENIGYATLDEI